MRSGAGFRLGIHLGLDCRAWPDSLPAELTEWLCRCSTEGQHLAAALCPLQKVGPVLHHLGAWLQVESVVVGGAHGVAWAWASCNSICSCAYPAHAGWWKPAPGSRGRSCGLCSPCAPAPSESCYCSSACRRCGRRERAIRCSRSSRRNSSSTSNACRASGTMCGVLIFMRSAGISQRACLQVKFLPLALRSIRWCAQRS